MQSYLCIYILILVPDIATYILEAKYYLTISTNVTADIERLMGILTRYNILERYNIPEEYIDVLFTFAVKRTRGLDVSLSIRNVTDSLVLRKISEESNADPKRFFERYIIY